jgi:hypothetical protein
MRGVLLCPRGAGISIRRLLSTRPAYPPPPPPEPVVALVLLAEQATAVLVAGPLVVLVLVVEAAAKDPHWTDGSHTPRAPPPRQESDGWGL